MLPYFPKSHNEMIAIRDDKIWEGYYSVSPILSEIRVRPQREGRESSFQDEQGKIRQIDYKKKSVTIQRNVEDARGMTPEDFVQAAVEPGAGMGIETMRSLYEMFDNVTKETGNIVNTGGGPITPDIYLEIMEKILWDFADDGTPILPTVSLGGEALAQFQRQFPEWVRNSDFVSRFNSITVKKREEFREREACRRLVD